jgi:hypothetical protein
MDWFPSLRLRLYSGAVKADQDIADPSFARRVRDDDPLSGMTARLEILLRSARRR